VMQFNLPIMLPPSYELATPLLTPPSTDISDFTRRRPFPVSILKTGKTTSALLTPFEQAKPGDITGFATRYIFDEDEAPYPHQSLGDVYFVGPTGHEARVYQALPDTEKTAHARVLLEHTLKTSDVHKQVVKYYITTSRALYTVQTFDFADARILMNEELLDYPDWDWSNEYADEFESYEPSILCCPCLVEVFGAATDLETKLIAEKHLEYLSALLPKEDRYLRHKWYFRE